MNKLKIKAIAITSGPEWMWYTVGKTSDGRVVAKIQDKSVEFENSLDLIYEVRDEQDALIVRIENCSVLVEYFEPTA